MALGTCLWVPLSSPSAGLGGASGLFMYLLHTHQPMQAPHPGPSMFCALLLPLQLPGLLQHPRPRPRGGGVDGSRVTLCTGSAPPPAGRNTRPHTQGGASCPSPAASRVAGRRRPHSDGRDPEPPQPQPIPSMSSPSHPLLSPVPLAESASSNCTVFLAVGEDLFVGVSLV